MARSCIEPECDRTVIAQDRCSMHYKRARKAGLGLIQFPSPSPICSKPHCDIVIRARGLCNKHYVRMMRSRIPKQPRENRYCSEPDCGLRAVARYLCNKHYHRRRKEILENRVIEPRVDRPAFCTESDCYEPHWALGLCRRHYNRHRIEEMTGHPVRPRPARLCIAFACVGVEHKGGLCEQHYQHPGDRRLCTTLACVRPERKGGLCEQHATQTLVEPEQRQVRPWRPRTEASPKVKCIGPQCDRWSYSHGLCRIHFRRAEALDALDLFETENSCSDQ